MKIKKKQEQTPKTPHPIKKYIGNGINKEISTSKIKKITASKKNRIEKGTRADPFGSKPHSNGEAFSRSNKKRNDKDKTTKKTTHAKKTEKKTLKTNNIIKVKETS